MIHKSKNYSETDTKVLTVSELTKKITRLFSSEPDFQDISIRGEVSNIKKHTSGHIYLTLKDRKSRINGVMFRGNAVFLKKIPGNGDEIIARGRISVYEPYGNYQFYIEEIKQSGIGDLYEKFEELKSELKEKGYFDEELKKPIPSFPKRVGIVTSLTGAALQDILNIAQRRFSNIPVLIVNSRVQGKEAAQEIAEAINKLNKIKNIDVIIAGRGGGSFEDLFPFNEKIVADAIFNSSIPVVSAVGHETDFSISDMVSDLRAPTPSAAAEIVFPEKEILIDKLESLKNDLTRIFKYNFEVYENILSSSSPWFTTNRFVNSLQLKEEHLDRLSFNLVRSFKHLSELKEQKLLNLSPKKNGKYLEHKINNLERELSNLRICLNKAIIECLSKKDNVLKLIGKSLELLDHKNTLKRGFSIVRKKGSDYPVRSINDIVNKENINIELFDGNIDAEISAIKGVKDD